MAPTGAASLVICQIVKANVCESESLMYVSEISHFEIFEFDNEGNYSTIASDEALSTGARNFNISRNHWINKRSRYVVRCNESEC